MDRRFRFQGFITYVSYIKLQLNVPFFGNQQSISCYARLVWILWSAWFRCRSVWTRRRWPRSASWKRGCRRSLSCWWPIRARSRSRPKVSTSERSSSWRNAYPYAEHCSNKRYASHTAKCIHTQSTARTKGTHHTQQSVSIRRALLEQKVRITHSKVYPYTKAIHIGAKFEDDGKVYKWKNISWK